ncbi:RNA binding protein, putative [Ricinus communis]|uniref:tRNA (guanosine(18)-2'-O)-methyltransferase TARBP1 n=1 Tax=Ricinus communis TaxID=3988 RepID=B9SEE0_RICCO|nr:RNA binding protein, putative [Ricinus communis]
MDTLISSLSRSFKKVPLSAIPAILDCILASTGLSPSSLFDSFLHVTKEFIKEEKLDYSHCDYLISMVGALCHLLKKPGADPDSMQSLIWKCFIPLMKMAHALEREMLNQIAESFFDVVNVTNSWDVLEATLVPFFLRSAGLAMDMLQNEESDIFEWAQHSVLLSGLIDDSNLDKEFMLSLSGSFPLPISCHVLAIILDSTLQSCNAASRTESMVENGSSYAQKLFYKLLWDLCNMSERLLLQSLEHRSCATGFLLPVDAESLVRKQSLHILKRVLQLGAGTQSNSPNTEKKSQEKYSIPNGMTKRAIWADKEAKSLGVGKLCNSMDSPLDGRQQWEAFILLYEMLEEYGTHLVEAAWEHQVTLLLQFSVSYDNFANSICGIQQNQTAVLGEVFSWLTILWQLGFRHDNPQVRCLIMQSFLGIEWMKYHDAAKSVPESFILGSFVEGLNDPVHHKDFGVKGVYTSRTIEAAARFLCQYTRYLNARKEIVFLHSLASVAKHQSFGRAGLMGLAECIASAACGVGLRDGNEAEWTKDALCDEVWLDSSSKKVHINKTDLLDVLRYVIESSKQHFNPKYRFRVLNTIIVIPFVIFAVCEKVLGAATSVVSTVDVPLEVLLHFVSTLPREFTDYGGPLRVKMQEWLLGVDKKHFSSEIQLLKSLQEFPERFTSSQHVVDAFVSFDDEDLDAWDSEVKRWARVLFLVIKEENHLVPIFKFLRNCGVDICKQCKHAGWSPVKFLVLTVNLIAEIRILWEREVERGFKIRSNSENSLLRTIDQLGSEEASAINEKFSDLFLSILEELVSFASTSCSIFWTSFVKDTDLPSSVRGKLGGPSQRRLSSSTATAVLEAVCSLPSVASVTSWCSLFKNDVQLKFAWSFMWKFFLKTNSSLTYDTESGAEVCLAAYEALAPVLRALVFTFSPLALDLIRDSDKSSSSAEEKAWLDQLVLSFLQNINNLLAVGVLVRSRRAVLLNWKWLCLESLLSIPHYAFENGPHLVDNRLFFSEAAIRLIFSDLVESLENAGEGSVLPMLRSIRLTFGLLASGNSGSLVSSCNGVDAQMMWHLVRSSWMLHVSNNKRRVAAIAALLSSVLHASVFADEAMHTNNNGPGPLKWFVENILVEGTKSPRTIRLAALHLTGLWLSQPRMMKYYIKELKLLTLYGSVAFDEDFEAELAENRDARTEVSLLAKCPDSELTEAFINTELYARVSVAVLLNNLADLANLVGSANENEDCSAALESGKIFLLELLDSAVNDKDLAKELYKKYSGIHRRKIRVWQMICVLSRFVTDDIVGKVTCSLHIALYRNNLPAVRQYLETFAINIYLKFPTLVGEQLVPILRDYDMRPQVNITSALSSYVFIAANIILHTSKAFQSRHLDELLPPILPLLTSHHHSLRGFTQLLVYQVLSKILSPLDCGASETTDLEKRCFEDLKSYLAKNPDCRRLRASMEGYLDAYNPIVSGTPTGIFINRVEELEFECVPTSLLEEVLSFLNDVREDLRCSMAKDVITIKNESFKIDENPTCRRTLPKELLEEASLDFQKKITPSKHEKKDADSSSILGSNAYKQLLEMEKEDELLDQSLQSRILTMERIRASRQHLILVASFLDRVPNLAGLARTCEVFRASGLAIADKSILHDKQFQLISVTAEKWVPIIEVPVNSVKQFLEKKKQEGYSILGLEQTANSVSLDQFAFPKKTVLVLGREKEGVPVDIIHILDACIEIPQLGVVRSLNVHVSGAIALWEYTRQQRSQ